LLLSDLKFNCSPVHSLEQRFALDKRIATGVFFLHAADFVHKNIRPETIVLFYDADGNRKYQKFIGEAYMKSRPRGVMTFPRKTLIASRTSRAAGARGVL